MRAKLMIMLLSFCLSACGLYRMPTEDDTRTSPTTNNPKVVGQHGNELAPSVAY